MNARVLFLSRTETGVAEKSVEMMVQHGLLHQVSHTLSACDLSRAFYNIASIASIRALVCYLLKMHNTNHSQFDVLDAYSFLLQILVNSVLCNFVKVEISM